MDIVLLKLNFCIKNDKGIKLAELFLLFLPPWVSVVKFVLRSAVILCFATLGEVAHSGSDH